MRRKISLYIEDRLADLDDQSLVLFNYTMEDLQNPVMVKNSYSQQVALPGTANNNEIFGRYQRLDRVTGSGFNVMERTPFKILNEMNEILVSGYLKLDSVQRQGSHIHSFSVSLFGSLGSFFYDLTTREDGSTSNLGDLAYRDRNGNLVTPNEETMELTADNIRLFWETLRNGATGIFNADWYNFLNFAPCLNGIPADFDAKKVLVTSGNYRGIAPSGGSANDRPHPDAGNAYLVTMGSDKTEDEVRDYRAYLQRPVINLSSFLTALVDRGGFFVSEGVSDMLGTDIWVTLPLPQRADDYAEYPVRKMFEGSMTPADLVISIAKRFGLVFETRNDGVHLLTRDEFFTDGRTMDIGRRIDRASMTINPMNISSKWYVWRDDVVGEFAEDYKKNWGKTYGEQKVNTGYQFDTGTKIVTESLKTRGAVQVLDESRMYFASWNALGEYLSASLTENLSFQGFSASGEQSSTISVPDFLRDWVQTEYYNEDMPYYNVFSKPQMYSKDRKPADGSGVLLFLDGFESVPNGGTTAGGYARMIWHLTDDDQSLYDLLNGGKPCWDMRRNVGAEFNYLPHFTRWKGSDSLEFGTPMELAEPLPAYPSNTIFERCWKTYISDRYDKDTSVVRCKVDLKGLNVGQGLLKNFYWFDNTIWVLNKISNYSLTTFDSVECEFVRVQDMDNYKNGQE